MQELELEIKKLIVSALQLEDLRVEDIPSDEPLFGEGLGLDSIDALELGVALRKRFGLKIETVSDDLKQHFRNVQSLAAFAPAKEDPKPSRPRSYGVATSWPGMRMCVLYDRSVTWRGLVVGTGNKTESLIGYTTLFGDSACAFNPIGDLYKSQVRQLSRRHRCAGAIIRKAPSADLWPGQTDETEAGFIVPGAGPAAVLEDRQASDGGGDGGDGVPGALVVERVKRIVATSEFKRQVPPLAKLGPRTTGVDYLYPRRRPGSAARP